MGFPTKLKLWQITRVAHRAREGPSDVSHKLSRFESCIPHRANTPERNK